jgi:hypothetical protein
MVVKHGILACQFIEEMSNLMNCEVASSFPLLFFSFSLTHSLTHSLSELNLFSLSTNCSDVCICCC